MVRHSKLESNNFALVREILKSRYGNKDINFDVAEISAKDGGRLSFIFEVKDGDKHAFVKIVKPGLVQDNIALSTIATETAREAGQPCPKTFAGLDGKHYQVVPDNIDGVNSAGLGIAGKMMTLVQHIYIDEVSEDLGDDLKLYEALGAYQAQLLNQLSEITRESVEEKDQTVTTDDPFGIPAIRKLFAADFDINESLTYLRDHEDEELITQHTDNLVDNLNPDDPISRAFSEGVIRGDHITMMLRLNELEKKLGNFDFPETLIHNEIKPANVGATKDPETGEWKITASFDFDQVGFGPAVKDLGRTISFFAFDKNTGEFFPERATATIKGWLKHKDLNAEEVEVLSSYIELGALTSYPVRASYLAEELQGIRNDAEVDRLDPSIHLQQIEALNAWLADHNIDELLPSKTISPESLRNGISPDDVGKADDRRGPPPGQSKA
jgi:Ser/Thr protein kinase RdoA (MazF antagonist)